MKKMLCFVLAFMMIFSSFCINVFAEEEIKIVINGQKLSMDQNPIIVEGRTLVPLRAIFDT